MASGRASFAWVLGLSGQKWHAVKLQSRRSAKVQVGVLTAEEERLQAPVSECSGRTFGL